MSETKQTITLPNAPQPSRVEAEKAQRRRRGDTSETRNMKLQVPEGLKDKDFVYRWVNDTEDGRIHDKTVSDDWEKVTIKGQNQEDVPVVRNAGHGLKTHLLRKPRKYHEEDKKQSLESITSIEKQMERGEQVAAGGLDKAVSYVPGGGNTISRGR
jgi:hypothetical protein